MSKMFAKKQAPKQIPTCEIVTGKANGKTYTLERNAAAGRFALKNEDGLVYSGPFNHCVKVAEEHVVEWETPPKLEFVVQKKKK